MNQPHRITRAEARDALSENAARLLAALPTDGTPRVLRRLQHETALSRRPVFAGVRELLERGLVVTVEGDPHLSDMKAIARVLAP